MPPLPATPSHALALYAEPLVAGRRVVAIDDASRGLGARLVELGARVVHLYDPNPERARAVALTPGEGASRALTVRALPAGEFDVRDGAFDVALVADLGLAPEPAALLARVRKLLAPEGAALVAARNPAAPAGSSSARAFDYYELFDMVSLQFEYVRMIGQVPFVGVALAELGLEDEPELTVDTQLVTEPDPPDVYLALASQSDVKLADYAIVQLPSSEGDRLAEPSLEGHRAELAAAQLRANLLAAQIEEMKTARLGAAADRAAEIDADIEDLAARLKEADARAGEHYTRAERLAHDVRDRETELERQRDRAMRVAKELEDEKREAAAREEQLAVLALELEALRRSGASDRDGEAVDERAGADEDEADEEQPDETDETLVARAEAAEARAAALEAELMLVAEGHTSELAQLEASLRERAQLLAGLEHELSRRERLVRELVATLEETKAWADASSGAQPAEREVAIAQAEVERLGRELAARVAEAHATRERLEALAGENEELRGKIDALALDVARREAEAASSAWRIAELTQQVSRLEAAQTELTVTIPPPGAGADSPREGELRRQLVEARTELDVLRQAMTQEHAARVRAESGEDLAQARAELARQAALLEQLSRELDAKDRVRIAQEVRD